MDLVILQFLCSQNQLDWVLSSFLCWAELQLRSLGTQSVCICFHFEIIHSHYWISAVRWCARFTRVQTHALVLDARSPLASRVWSSWRDLIICPTDYNCFLGANNKKNVRLGRISTKSQLTHYDWLNCHTFANKRGTRTLISGDGVT
jgi:hypothetical protein